MLFKNVRCSSWNRNSISFLRLEGGFSLHLSLFLWFISFLFVLLSVSAFLVIRFLQAGNHFTGKGVKKFLVFLDDFDVLDRCKGFKLQITKDKTLLSSIKAWFVRTFMNISERIIFTVFKIFRRYVLSFYTSPFKSNSNFSILNISNFLFATQENTQKFRLEHE